MVIGMNLHNYQETKENVVLQTMKQICSSKYGLANLVMVEDYGYSKVKVGSNSYILGNVIPTYITYVKNRNDTRGGGGGASLNKERSRIKAYGEFIERFCGINSLGDHDKEIIYDTYDNLSSSYECLDMTDLIDFEDDLYDDSDIPFFRYTQKNVISWVKGKNLTNKKDTWIPAQKAFIGTKLINGEQRHIPGLSTGLACGSNYTSALISGIYEVIERDSFMLTWQLKLHGRRIIVDSIKNSELSLLYRHIITHITGNGKLNIYDISRTEGVYTILTFIRNDNPDSYGLITSAASDVNPEKALLKSLEELCLTQAYSYKELLKDVDKKCQTMKKTDISSLRKYISYYSTGRHSCEFDFIDKSNCFVKLNEMKNYIDESSENVLTYIINLLRKDNKTVYATDITRQEIESCGLCVVRAIIVGYNDLECAYNWKQTKNIRLKDFKERYNCSINDAPHPFP